MTDPGWLGKRAWTPPVDAYLPDPSHGGGMAPLVTAWINQSNLVVFYVRAKTFVIGEGEDAIEGWTLCSQKFSHNPDTGEMHVTGGENELGGVPGTYYVTDVERSTSGSFLVICEQWSGS